MSKYLNVGIDVASEENAISFLDQEGNFLEKTFMLPNNQPGVEDLERKIIELVKEKKIRKIRIATESSSFYDFHLADYLSSSTPEKLPRSFQIEVFRFNPKLIHDFKKNFSPKDKTDKNDAYFIAQKLRFGDLPQPYSRTRLYLPLQRLTRYRFHLQEAITREKGSFLTHLFLKYSSWQEVKPLSSPYGATSSGLILEFFSREELSQLPLKELVDFLLLKSRKRISKPKAEKIASEIQRMTNESYRIEPKLTKSVNIILASSLSSIRALTKAQKEIDLAVTNEFRAFPNTLTSVPGLGSVFSAGMFAEIGDIARFPNHAGLAKFAGLWWPRKQSGKFEAEDRPLQKSGNTYLRYYLCEAANSLRVHNEEYKAFFQKKFQEVRKHQHKRAIVLTARKLVRLVFSLLKKGQLYDPNKVIF